MSIHEVREKDPDYLFDKFEKFRNNQKYAETSKLVDELLDHEIYTRNITKAVQQGQEHAFRSKVIEVTADLAKAIQDGRRGFRDSIASDLGKGVLPNSNTIDLICDIIGKTAGRKGSYAYHEKIIEINNILGNLCYSTKTCPFLT